MIRLPRPHRLFVASVFVAFAWGAPRLSVAQETQAADAASSETAAKEAAPEEPALDLSGLERPSNDPAELNIEMVDGLVLSGRLDQAPSADTLLIVLPNVDEKFEAYDGLVEALNKRGTSVARVYVRGAGTSTEWPDGSRIDYRDFAPTGAGSRYFDMVRDTSTLMGELRLHHRRVVVLGSRVTASVVAQAVNNAMLGAGSGVVLLTPAKELRGLKLDAGGFAELDAGALLLYAVEDRAATLAAGDLLDALGEGSSVKSGEIDGDARGAGLLENQAAVDAIADFVAGADSN